MDIQLLIVAAVIVGSIVFAGLTFARKTRGFSAKADCGADCGCGKQAQKR